MTGFNPERPAPAAKRPRRRTLLPFSTEPPSHGVLLRVVLCVLCELRGFF